MNALYATHDALGNCTAILNTSGAVQERYGYSAFGVRRIMQADFSSRATSSFAWDFGFQGEFLDDETGYIIYGFRYYLPYVGKWINRDLIEEDGGNNIYLMAENDAVNKVDYMGLAPIPLPPKIIINKQKFVTTSCACVDLRVAWATSWWDIDGTRSNGETVPDGGASLTAKSNIMVFYLVKKTDPECQDVCITYNLSVKQNSVATGALIPDPRGGTVSSVDVKDNRRTNHRLVPVPATKGVKYTVEIKASNYGKFDFSQQVTSLACFQRVFTL